MPNFTTQITITVETVRNFVGGNTFITSKAMWNEIESTGPTGEGDPVGKAVEDVLDQMREQFAELMQQQKFLGPDGLARLEELARIFTPEKFLGDA
jgi:hypothetical protein